MTIKHEREFQEWFEKERQIIKREICEFDKDSRARGWTAAVKFLEKCECKTCKYFDEENDHICAGCRREYRHDSTLSDNWQPKHFEKRRKGSEKSI